MAYADKNLQHMHNGGSTGSGSGSVAHYYSYATNDTKAEVLASNYFDAAAGLLGKGDVIIASVDRDGTPDALILIVTAATSSAVTVAQGSNAA